MSFKAIKQEWKLTALLLFGKMCIAPLLLFIVVIVGFGGFNDLWRMALIEVAMPPVVSAGAIVIKAGLSFISVPLWLFFA